MDGQSIVLLEKVHLGLPGATSEKPNQERDFEFAQARKSICGFVAASERQVAPRTRAESDIAECADAPLPPPPPFFSMHYPLLSRTVDGIEDW